MLQPARTKYRKLHKGRIRGKANKGASMAFGEYGLQATESGKLTSRQIEAARIAITRHVRRGAKLWIRVFPHKPITKKPAETRMGKGKGDVDSYVAPVKRGTMIYEISGINMELVKEALAVKKVRYSCAITVMPPTAILSLLS